SRSLEILRHLLGDYHPNYLSARTNLADLYGATGRQQEGLDLYRLVVDLFFTHHGPNHPDTGIQCMKWGQALMAIGKREEGQARLRDADDILTRTLGPDHPDTQRVRNQLLPDLMINPNSFMEQLGEEVLEDMMRELKEDPDNNPR
ncbi:MAG: tetratricopeptide repeat protein, partial [Verrucomicrobiota bacterium]